MNTTELPLPEKIFPVEYAGFFDFNEEGIYDTSVINRDDYPNAEQIANEISKRYNNFEKMKEACEALIELRDFIANHHGDDSDETPMLDRALEAIQNLPSLK